MRDRLAADVPVQQAADGLGMRPHPQQGSYDHKKKLVIDPTIEWTRQVAEANVLAVDSSGNMLSTGFLFVRNLLRSSALSPGFDTRQTVCSQINLPPSDYKDPKRIAAYAELGVHELTTLPGITAAAAARIIPFTDSNTRRSALRFSGGESVTARFNWNAVTGGYFEALSIPMAAGRTFQPSDTGTPERPVIVSTGFVNRYLNRQTTAAVGRTFAWGDNKTHVYRIIGVASNTKNMTLGEQDGPQIYEYLPNIDEARPRSQFVAKSSIAPALQLKAVNDALRRVEPNAGLETQTMFSSIGFAFLPSQIGAAVLGSMGLLGLLLAMIGLYGVMTYTVALRTPEIGVRMAIGAPKSAIFKLAFSDAGKMVALGTAIGLTVALVATRPLASFLVQGLPPHDPVTFIAVLVVFVITAGLASWGPARRATSIDPMSCLRHD